MRLFSLLAVLALASPAIAQTQNEAKKADPDRQICRRVMATGTILGGKKECHTKAEWAQISGRAQIDRDNRSSSNNGRGSLDRTQM